MMRIIMYCQNIQHITFISLKLCRSILMLEVDKLNSLEFSLNLSSCIVRYFALANGLGDQQSFPTEAMVILLM